MDKTEILRLVSLGPIQTSRLASDIVWNSLFIADYRNRYDIDEHVVSDFADGYLEWLNESFECGGDIDKVFAAKDKYVNDRKSGYSFYDYTHYMYCVD